jgi:hypothetical protein
MLSTLPHESIASSLLAFWSNQFSAGVTTVYPGMKVNTTDLSEWVEIWIDSWSRKPQRIGGVPLIDVAVSVHCFVKSGTDAGRIHAVTDAVRLVFSQESVPLHDFEQSGEPRIGTIRIKEPETRNLTKHNLESQQIVLHHTVVLFRGFAQADGTSI